MLPANRQPGREPLTIVEIDQDYCALAYGIAPCQAEVGVTGDRKCFQSLATCQDAANYTLFVGSPLDRNVLTLRFATPSSRLPRDVTLIPSVISVETEPTEINIGGGDKSLSPLGRRASVTITFRDHPYRDLLVDPYRTERDYDPLERGTFWSKWIARNPYHENRSLRIREGFVGQSLEEMMVRHYLIERIEGPSNGEVRIVAKDPLRRVDSDRALAPVPNTGMVLTNFTAVAANFTLTPAGIGNSEYPSSGVGRIGSEVFTYTRVNDVVTFVARGYRSTTASTHSAGDVVQEVLVFTDYPVADAIYDLITLYSGIDSSFIAAEDWLLQTDRWLGGFELNGFITEPTGVGDLLGEILEQSIIFLWWDEVQQKIKLQVIRPFDPLFDETAAPITDDANLIAGSVEITRKPDERVSQVWVYYDQIDPTKGVEDRTNYSKRLINRNVDAEGDTQYGEPRITEIFARFLDANGNGAANTISTRTLARYVDGPVAIEFDLDAKDQAVTNGSIIALSHHGLVDDTGSPRISNYQLTSLRIAEAGHRIECKARPFLFAGRYGFIMANDAPVYDLASDNQKTLGAWIAPNGSPDSGIFDDGGLAYTII